jgi:hypothetical protein
LNLTTVRVRAVTHIEEKEADVLKYTVVVAAATNSVAARGQLGRRPPAPGRRGGDEASETLRGSRVPWPEGGSVARGGEFDVEIDGAGGKIRVRHTLSERQIDILMAGGAINWRRQRQSFHKRDPK